MKYILMFENFRENPFWIFGSEDSRDWDVIVSVDDIPSDISKSSDMCKYWNTELSKILLDKPINSNLGIFRNGDLLKVFKGTPDEVQNSIWYTYDKHKQFYPIPIDGPTDRDLSEKIIRVARFVLSFYSRTHLRSQIKSALRGNLGQRLEALKKIDFTKMTDFPGKNENPEDIWKVIAFQFGQVFSLIDGHESESYTKSGVIKNYPDLSNIIGRGGVGQKELETLNRYLDRFIKKVESSGDLKQTESPN